jgi:hypothetical protein
MLRRISASVLAAALLAVVTTHPAQAAPFGTTFGYQGRLLSGGTPANGNYDLRFRLFDSPLGGIQLGPTITRPLVAITDGLITEALDFGAVYDGNQRWLDIEVKGPSDAAFIALGPRQELLPAPYVLWSKAGGSSFTLPYIASLAAPIPLIQLTNTDLNANAKGIRVQSQSSHALDAVTLTGPLAAVRGQHNGELTDIGIGVNGVGFQGATGVRGDAQGGPGVHGASSGNDGVVGQTSAFGKAGVFGENNLVDINGAGVRGRSTGFATGVEGVSQSGFGVYGVTSIVNKAGVRGHTTHPGGYGGWFSNADPNGLAIYAQGDASIEGEVSVQVLNITGGADLAERFETRGDAEPGTVLAIAEDAPGRLEIADEPYCRRVAGVVSGANALAAGAVLGRGVTSGPSEAIALSGRVWVRCDATDAPIRPGDLLTTAPRAGHAMKAVDPSRATGAILGKAMSSLETGTGLVLVLVSLQ